MSMQSLIDQAKEATFANNFQKVGSFSETIQDGSVVTCTPIPASNPFETVVGNVRMTWAIDGKRATAAAVQKLYLAHASDADKAEIKSAQEKAKWLRKFGIK